MGIFLHLKKQYDTVSIFLLFFDLFPCQHKQLNHLAIILFKKKSVNHDANPSTKAHIINLISRGMGVGSKYLAVSCFVFVCLFVCLFFQLLRWMIILVLSLTSGWGFLVFLFLFSLQNVQFPHHISRVRLIVVVVVVSPVGKVVCLFFISVISVCLFVCILFCFILFVLFVFVCLFVLFCLFFVLLPKIPPPWYQMVPPYPYSITQMIVDIASSTILNYRAIQWKI